MILAWLLTFGVSAQEACRPTMAQAMQRALKRCQTTVVGTCPKAIQMTAFVIGVGDARTVQEIFDAVGDLYRPTSRYPKSDMLEGATLLMSELGMLDKLGAPK